MDYGWCKGPILYNVMGGGEVEKEGGMFLKISKMRGKFLNFQNSLGLHVFVASQEGRVHFLFNDFRVGYEFNFFFLLTKPSPTPPSNILNNRYLLESYFVIVRISCRISVKMAGKTLSTQYFMILLLPYNQTPKSYTSNIGQVITITGH